MQSKFYGFNSSLGVLVRLEINCVNRSILNWIADAQNERRCTTMTPYYTPSLSDRNVDGLCRDVTDTVRF